MIEHFENTQQTMNEHHAWRAVVREMRLLGVEIDDEATTPLVRAVERWGEELAALRAAQPEFVRRQALREKRERYLKLQNDTEGRTR